MNSFYTSTLVLNEIVLVIMCILVHENDRIPRDSKRLMYLTYLLVALSALAEWSGVQLDGWSQIPAWILKAVKCADYVLTPMAGGALIMQMQLRNRGQKVMVIILAVNAFAQLLSIPFGWMITVDASNHYSHGPLYPAYLAVCFGTILFIIGQFILYGRLFKRQNRASLYTIMFLVIVAIILQEIPNGSRTIYIGMTFGAVLMFIHYTEYSQLKADQTMDEQRIKLMLSQIKPHFLYNTLGAIEALCERDPQTAKMVTRKFSKYLRGNMSSLGEENLILFDQELQHTQLYLELEQIRFGEALQVRYEINARGFLIPSLTLEPIAENAVKHGIRMNPDGRGTVRIRTGELADEYELQVIDDGPGYNPKTAPEDEEHIGIKNVRDRLEAICGGTLAIHSGPEGGTVVTIRLPKQKKGAHYADLRDR